MSYHIVATKTSRRGHFVEVIVDEDVYEKINKHQVELIHNIQNDVVQVYSVGGQILTHTDEIKGIDRTMNKLIGVPKNSHRTNKKSSYDYTREAYNYAPPSSPPTQPKNFPHKHQHKQTNSTINREDILEWAYNHLNRTEYEQLCNIIQK